ncbi:hypothetical protein JI747_014600 [Chryseobacterium sp. RG1]|uniref:Dolichyl-phosphate-mannose-protein mannosyltransferase n=1 Tax=Chryseobacterium tagetis TaxID=2801334 RepID=A0ABS8A4N5_9FLAO|nr:hypothetical protein [Chryseobacterium tagetis]MCA6068418.1 hypothetical protein [Chryseobacterium tagetis]
MINKVFDFFEKEKGMKYIMFFIYFIINALFLIKYGIRQDKVPVLILIVLFCVFHFLIFEGYNFFIKRFKITKQTIYLFVLFNGIFYVVLSHLVKDPYQLKIDRWQTIEYSLDYWLHGKYIYATKNFMGNIPSYLPGQLLLLVLFRFLGNVGYIQAASLVLFSFAVIKEFKNNNIRFFGILLLGASLSFIYEAVCKSDFISSFIITSAFIMFWHRKFEGNYFKEPILLGVILGIICLTRSVVVIPLILFLFQSFLNTNWESKIKFSLAFLIIVGTLLLSVLLPAENFDYILQYNPLQMQGQSNTIVVLFFLILTIIFSLYIKNIQQVFYLSTIVIFCLMSAHLIEQGIRGSSYNFFNITYLAAALPFCIVSSCFLLDRKAKIETEI